MEEYPNGTYAGFVRKQQSAEAEVEEGDANEDEDDPNAKVEKNDEKFATTSDQKLGSGKMMGSMRVS